MNDISGYLLAGEAVTLGGVSLALGRGAARVHILKDIDLHIGRGEAVALLGPSGSGKSTLLMVMTGLERPDSGSVVIAGQDLLGLDEDRLARFRGKNIGIVFQAFHLIPTMTALENVAVPHELAGIRDADAIAARELAAVGLAQRARHGSTHARVCFGHYRRRTRRGSSGKQACGRDLRYVERCRPRVRRPVGA